MLLRKRPRKATRDRTNKDPPEVKEILTVEQIGPRRSLTPEGFLLCEAVPIARTGVMIYGPGEVPIQEGPDGLVYITRGPEELFSPSTLASFTGKAVTDEHPDDDVNPSNWAELARGIAINVRQGTGEDADVILADLLITDARTIRDIEAMKREVSAGYAADYQETGPGRGSQAEIIGNHIALVERGRCGPRCAIGDHSSTARKDDMATQKVTQQKTPPRRRIAQATLDALMEQLSEPDASTMDEEGDGHTHIHIHGFGSTAPATQGAGPADAKDSAAEEDKDKGKTVDDANEARFASLEAGHKEIIAQLAALTKALSGKGGAGGTDPAGGGKTGDAVDPDKAETSDENPFAKKDEDKEEKKDDKSKTSDSAALETSYKDVLSGCEVLVPGFRVPTFDSTATRTATIDSMCATRRKALDAFGATNEGSQVLQSITDAKTVDTAGMTCPNVAILFRAAVGAKKLINNSNSTRDAGRIAEPTKPNKGPAPKSLADLNKIFREHYKAK